MSDNKDIQQNEFIDIKEELKIEKQEENTISKRRKTRRIIIGGVFSFFAFIGVIAILLTGIVAATIIFDDTEERQEYAQKLSTLAIYDPLPVEDVSLIDEKILYLTGIWAAVINEDTTQFEKNEYDETLLPAIVVDSYIESIFGKGLDLIYKTFDDSGITYTFDEEKQAYIIPVTSIPTGYTIEVVEIEQSLFATEKTLIVAYLEPATSWTDIEQTSIVKYVEYVFEKQNDDYYLVAIRESNREVEENLDESQATPEPISVPESNDATPPPAAADVASEQEGTVADEGEETTEGEEVTEETTETQEEAEE